MIRILYGLVFLTVFGCTSTSTPTADTYTSPFKYCAAVHNIDEPDDRYQGPRLPPEVISSLKDINVLPARGVLSSSDFCSWRCMDAKVVACCKGANIPCGEKADADKTPTKAMADYCSENPGSQVIPAVVAGRATLYSWRCSGTTAVPEKQTLHADARGYLQEFWHPLSVQ